MKRIAIFASGSGTNAEAIAHYFAHDPYVEVAIVITNRAKAGVHDRMARLGITTANFPATEWRLPDDGGEGGRNVLNLLRDLKIDFVALAGFLAFVPPLLLDAYKGRMVNIHPSLLPRHGGKGMWGENVHKSVLEAGDKQSGITIHLVNDRFDEGKILLQATCDVLHGDTPDTLAARIHPLEHRYFPQVIESMLKPH